MVKKIFGFFVAVLGIGLIVLTVYIFVNLVLSIVNGVLINHSIFQIIRNFAGLALLGFIGIALIKAGKLFFYYDRFSPEDIALKIVRDIYKKEDLKSQDIKPTKSSQYKETKNIDLADIYKQIDPAKYPEIHQDLLSTIKSRIESK